MFNPQGQAHIVSTALRLRTWFSIDPQTASINPTINISIVFICAFLVDCGRIICHPAIKNDSDACRIGRCDGGIVAAIPQSETILAQS
jgi:hypothetical protein